VAEDIEDPAQHAPVIRPWDASHAREMRRQTPHLRSRAQKRQRHCGTSANRRFTPHRVAARGEWILTLTVSKRSFASRPLRRSRLGRCRTSLEPVRSRRLVSRWSMHHAEGGGRGRRGARGDRIPNRWRGLPSLDGVACAVIERRRRIIPWCRRAKRGGLRVALLRVFGIDVSLWFGGRAMTDRHKTRGRAPRGARRRRGWSGGRGGWGRR